MKKISSIILFIAACCILNAQVASVQVNESETSDYVSCVVDKISVTALGGLNYTWHYGAPDGPSTYLSSPKSATTDVVKLPAGEHYFYVDITQTVDKVTLKLHIAIIGLPKVLFEVDKPVICGHDTIKLTNLSQNATVYKWDKQVDNGLIQFISREKDFNELLENTTSVPKVIRYRLTASNNAGCNDTLSKIVTVFPQVKANFFADPILACSPVEVKFTNLSSSNAAEYIWNFGDHSSSDISNPAHKFYNSGTKDTTYKIRLVVKSSLPYFCTDTMVSAVTVHPEVKTNFSTDASIVCGSSEVHFTNLTNNVATTFTWNFGDQSTTYIANPTHQFSFNGTEDTTYRIRLTASSNDGCSDTISSIVKVLPKLKANFSPDVTIGCSPFNVHFTNLSDNNAGEYIWDFGDQWASDLANPTHNFYNNGTKDTIYKVRLVVKPGSPYFCSDTMTGIVSVLPQVKALFDISTPVICAGSEVKFTNLSQNATINRWTKQANNEQPETFVPANLNFTEIPANTTGVRKVIKYRLTVSSNQGCNDTISHSITVFPQVVAKFSTDVNTGVSPLTVHFTNLSTGNARNAWDFGDQISDDITNPDHIFYNIGTKDSTVFSTRLTAISSDGCTDTTSQTITVYANSQVFPKIISSVKPSFSEHAVKVYPNPAQDLINIEYNLTQPSDVILELLDPTGKLLNKTMESRPSGDNMSKLHIGIYQAKFLIIKISINGKSTEFKVIK